MEKPPLVSVCTGSNRPGGIDVLLAGLKGQTFEDFEVIFVDGRYFDRHVEVLEAVKKSGLKQPFFHVPNHRFNDNPIFGTACAGYNTAFALAAGTYVVMLLDYAYVGPGWLTAHVEHLKEGRIVMGPHEYRTIPSGALAISQGLQEFTRESVDALGSMAACASIAAQKTKFSEISIFRKEFEASDLSFFPVETGDTKCQMKTGPSTPSYFNTKNESFLLDDVLAINGMDENYDRGRGPGDPDLGMRLALTKSRPTWVVSEAIAHCLNPRRLMPNMNILVENGRLPAPFEKRWNVADGNNYFNESRKTWNGLEGIHRAPNPFEIEELSAEIWHWRDLCQEKETLIEKNVVGDSVYFGLPEMTTKHLPRIPHLFDRRTQLNHIIWHEDPNLEKFVRHLIDTVKPDRWIETGTHMGWTSAWVAENYPHLPVYTIEVDPEFYQKSKENLAQWPQVHVALGSSPDFLEAMRPMLSTGVSIFWLDAHWWPPVPLRRECKFVASLEKYVCLLDDFSCWDPDFSGDTFYGRAPNGGSAHLNDLYYVGPEMGYSCWRPNYKAQPGYKGYGLFLKGVEYSPPADIMKFETLLPP